MADVKMKDASKTITKDKKAEAPAGPDDMYMRMKELESQLEMV